ncbi:MAG: hypothetical protein WED01_03215 [Candidatus Rokuibacteriota bacterium]
MPVEFGEGGAASGTEPGMVPGVVVDDDAAGGGVPYGTLIGGSVVLGMADGELPSGETGVVGTDCGDCPAPGLPRLGTEPGDCGPPGLPRLGTEPGDWPAPGLPRLGTDPGDWSCGGSPVWARTVAAGAIRMRAASVHAYLMGLHIRNRGATMPR